MVLNVCCPKCVKGKAPCVEGFTKCVRLPSGVDIYRYERTSLAQTGEGKSDCTYLFHRNSDKEVNKRTVIADFDNYNSKCVTCKHVVKRIRNFLMELTQFKLNEVFAICDHCEKLAEGIKCKRCLYIISKFKCSYLQMAERNRRLNIWISKMTELQEILHTQAISEDVKKIQDTEDLRRILNEMYRSSTHKATPRILEYDWTGVSLDELYEHQEVLRSILEQMRERLSMASPVDMLGADLRDDLGISISQAAIRPPDNTPITTIKMATSPTPVAVKMSEKTVSMKDPTVRIKTIQGRTEDATRSTRATTSTTAKIEKSVEKTGKLSAKVSESSIYTRIRTEDSPHSPGTLESAKNNEIVQQKSTSRDKKPIKRIPKDIKGSFTYQLSDKHFIDIGWTVLPVLKIERVYHLYEMTAVLSDNNWMALNRDKGVVYYDNGPILAVFKQNGSVTWYYRNGMVALVYNGPKPAESDDGSQLMCVVYSFEVDTRKKQSILAKFDYCGNGVVYDNQGNERLKYNQNTGKLFNPKGTPTTWLWHNLNEPPTYRKQLVDTYARPDAVLMKTIEDIEKKKSNSRVGLKKEPSRKKFEEESKVLITLEQQKAKEMMSRIEMEKYAKNNVEFETYTVRMNRIMINEFSYLKVICQTQIYLMFHDGTTQFRLDLGLKINEHEVTRREYVFVSNEDYNICEHFSKSRETIIEQEPVFGDEDIV